MRPFFNRLLHEVLLFYAELYTETRALKTCTCIISCLPHMQNFINNQLSTFSVVSRDPHDSVNAVHVLDVC